MPIKILDNCCSPVYLDFLKRVIMNSENWSLKYPMGEDVSIDEKFPKIVIVENGVPKHPILTGLVMGLLIQIHQAGGQDLFIPEIVWCGISIKDKHIQDKVHKDYDVEDGMVKIVGIINSDWEQSWGGGFFHDETSYYVKPTSFCIFDPSKKHAAEEILVDKKRFAIDFSVHRNKQSLEKQIQYNEWFRSAQKYNR